MIDQHSAEQPGPSASADKRVALTGVENRPMSGGPTPGGLEHVSGRARIIAPSLLLPGEIIVFEIKPSLWYVVFESVPIAAAGMVLFLLALSIHELPEVVRHWGAVIGISAIGLRVALALLQWLGRTYVLTDRRILMQYGVFSVEVECMGLEEIASTFVAQAAAQKILGIGSLFFRCGHEGRRDSLVWEHISHPKEVHARIVAQIDRWKHTLEMTKTT
jgi:hypothetical protein